MPSLAPPTYAVSGLPDTYALTWVKGLSPAAVVTRTGGRRIGQRRRPAAGWSALPGLKENETVVAVTPVGGWALMVEETASPVGAGDDMIGTLSKGTRLVLFEHNYQGADRFVLAEDGTILVDFDPGYPPDRAGSRPDLLVAQMRAAGLNPTVAETATAQPEPAALALTESLTGVPITRPLLRDSSYLAAAITVQTTDDTEQQRRPGY